jgi:hypothetical protein
MVSTWTYGAPGAVNTTFAATEDVAYYTPIVVSATTTLDRIQVATGTTFSGTATCRLGIYADGGGKPTTLILDAGTFTTSTANQSQSITINQALQPGLYWLTFVSQDPAGTNTYGGLTTPYYQMAFGATSPFSSVRPGLIGNGVTGALAGTAVVDDVASPVANVRVRVA